MAHKLLLSAPLQGMPHIWNVTNSVGTETTEANNPNDVRLVKVLVSLLLDIPGVAARCLPGLRIKPTMNDTMDQNLGFWIYFGQVESKSKSPTDGKVTPSPKFPSQQFFIVRANLGLFQFKRTVWESLPDNPLCGPLLKKDLLTTR